MSKYLVAGLGNIGSDYVGTRHNIGFEIADAFVAKNLGQFSSARLADVAELRLRGKAVIVIKPTTYMNLSGKAVKYWLEKENIPVENLLVLVDDVAIPTSKLRLRPAGSSAGHNGLKSIEELLATDKYPKLRFGIGGDYPKGRQVDFVLGKWNESEKPLVQLKITKSVEVIESVISRGIERTMNDVNKLEFIL